ECFDGSRIIYRKYSIGSFVHVNQLLGAFPCFVVYKISVVDIVFIYWDVIMVQCIQISLQSAFTHSQILWARYMGYTPASDLDEVLHRLIRTAIVIYQYFGAGEFFRYPVKEDDGCFFLYFFDMLIVIRFTA